MIQAGQHEKIHTILNTAATELHADWMNKDDLDLNDVNRDVIACLCLLFQAVRDGQEAVIALLKGMHGVRRVYTHQAEDEIQTAGSNGRTDEVKDEGTPPIATDHPSYPKFYRSKTGGLVRVNRSRTGKIYALYVNEDRLARIVRATHNIGRTPFQPRTILEDANSDGTREVSPNDVYNTVAWLKAKGLITTVAGGMCKTTSPNLLRAVHRQFMELPLYDRDSGDNNATGGTI